MSRHVWVGVLALTGLGVAVPANADAAPPPDITVAADGSGDFKSVQAAVQSIPRGSRERRIILVKDGLYTERVTVDAPNVTLRGESRKGTRIEFAQATPLNLSNNAHDFVIENMTVKNTQGVLGVHAFAVQGRADRTVIVDCDVLSHGNDTIALWRTPGAGGAPADDPTILKDSGRYYHARLNVTGSVDFVCPRGWCYMTDSTLTELNPGSTAAMWHDGSGNPDKKFVMRGCRFDGVPGWWLARHHHDAHFYFIDCVFSKVMRDTAPYRVVYPLDGGKATEENVRRNAELDRTNVYGERAYYHNSHRDGNDYVWHKNNLSSAPGSPKPDQITAKWTFAGTWDPEDAAGPKIVSVTSSDGKIRVKFAERVTVKGKPGVKLAGGTTAPYDGGSGSDTLVFTGDGSAAAIELNGGVIIATQASATLRQANLAMPDKPN